MGLFQTSNGESTLTGKKTYQGGGSTIPEGTKLLARITEAGWETADRGFYEGQTYFAMRLDVSTPPYDKRKLFPKLHVHSTDKDKRDKALSAFGVLCELSGEDMTPFQEDESKLDNLELSRIFVGMEVAIEVGVYNGNNFVNAWAAAGDKVDNDDIVF